MSQTLFINYFFLSKRKRTFVQLKPKKIMRKGKTPKQNIESVKKLAFLNLRP